MGAVVSAVAAIEGFVPVVKEVLDIIQKGVQTAQQVLNTVDEKLKGLPLADNQKKSLRELAACAASKLIDGTTIPKSTLQEIGKRFGEAFDTDVTNFADQFTNALNEVTTIDPRIHTN